MRIAAIADVHGNRIALEAVLAHIALDPPDLLVNLGDLLSGPFDPVGTADILMNLGCVTIAGNHERQLLEGGLGLSDEFTLEQLERRHLDWISTLPQTASLSGGDVFACHGSPAGGDLDYLLEFVTNGRTVLGSAEYVRPKLAGIGASKVVLCGHTHKARVALVDGVLVVNPGSVGMPAFSDDEPEYHVVEAGAPHARYAVIERQTAGWSAALIAVPFNFEAVALQAERAGRPDCAYAARTGLYLAT